MILTLDIIKKFYFGHTQEADAFLKHLGQNSEAEAILRLSNGYINQMVINRKVFTTFSRMATDVIGYAKHRSATLDTRRFSEAFTNMINLTFIPFHIRKISVGQDEYRMHMAMGFEKADYKSPWSIKFKDAELEYQKEKLQATAPIETADILKSTDNSKAFITNFQTLFNQSLKIQLFGKTYIPSKIYQNAISAIDNIIAILDKTNLNFSAALAYVPEAGKDSFETSIKTLLAYNIPAYRVRKALLKGYALERMANGITIVNLMKLWETREHYWIMPHH